MRKFDYTEDYRLLPITVSKYIEQLKFEINLLNEKEPNSLYDEALKMLDEFSNKYKNLYNIEREICDDLLKPYNVEYWYKYKKWPDDASIIGKKVEEDLKRIFEMEERLKLLAIKRWKQLTKFEDIKNGEKFMTVGHASYLAPGTKNTGNLRLNDRLYISCSVFSNRELNTFSDIKTVYLTDVNEDNYISSSYDDSVTGDFDSPQFETMKVIEANGEKHYIKVGYSVMLSSKNRAVTAISTPELIEKLSVERELEITGNLYSNECLTNEVVLDRTTTNVTGALLISDGCDLLLNEYYELKRSGIRFKCINKGLYRKKAGLPEYSESQYQMLISSLKSLLLHGKISVNFIKNYYNEVVIPMDYSDEVKKKIEDAFKEYFSMFSTETFEPKKTQI